MTGSWWHVARAPDLPEEPASVHPPCLHASAAILGFNTPDLHAAHPLAVSASHPLCGDLSTSWRPDGMTSPRSDLQVAASARSIGTLSSPCLAVLSPSLPAGNPLGLPVTLSLRCSPEAGPAHGGGTGVTQAQRSMEAPPVASPRRDRWPDGRLNCEQRLPPAEHVFRQPLEIAVTKSVRNY